jgi:sec-independent protein translocase protein TatB
MSLAEMAVIAIVALLVLGPERLPKAARTVGFYVRKARQSWYSVRSEFERELAAEELKRSLKLDEVHATLQQTASSVREGLALEHGAPAQPVGQPVTIDDDGLSAEERARQSEALIEPAQIESPDAPMPNEPTAGASSPVSASAPSELASAMDAPPAPDTGTKHVDADPGQRDHSPAGSR